MNIKQSIIILSVFFIPILCFAQNMDKTIDRFYVNYNHPIIRQGANLLGTIILQNNNNEGFALKLVSDNGGVLKVNNSTHGSNDINYYITFESTIFSIEIIRPLGKYGNRTINVLIHVILPVVANVSWKIVICVHIKNRTI